MKVENKYYVKDLGGNGFLKSIIRLSMLYLYLQVWIFLMTIYDGDSMHMVFIVLSFILLIYLCIQIKNNGLYIEGDSIYYKDIVKREIKPEKIKGIKITKDTMPEGTKSYFVPRVDENGNYVYCMIFLKELYDDMRTYNYDRDCFSSEYHECIMFITVYDLSAINRLRELIPDLVVMYEEE